METTMTKPNPYNWQRVNPGMFFGRLGLASDLVQQLAKGNSFGITGGRKMGKTTLLRRVERELLNYSYDAMKGGLLIVPVYVETTATPLNESPDPIYWIISKSITTIISRLTGATLPVSHSTTIGNFNDFLIDTFASCSNYRLQVILLFDEIEPITKLVWGRAFFAQWRSLLHNTPELSEFISAVFSGSSEMFEIARDIGSPLGNILIWRELELFSLKDTEQLISVPIQRQWPPEFINEVHNITGGHPFLIQYFMSHVCDTYQSLSPHQALSQTKIKFVTEQKFLFQNWLDKFDNTATAIYSQVLERGPLKRRTLISEFGESANRSISILAHTGVVRIDNLTETVYLEGSLFQDWFKINGSVSVTPTLAEHVDALLKNIERRLRYILTSHFNKKYKSDWLQVRISNSTPERWREILKRSQLSSATSLNNDVVLKNLDLGDLFDLALLGTEWSDLSHKFIRLSRDTKKARLRFEERKDHLVFVRNKLRHVNEDQLTSGDLLKAQAFCVELLECLS